MTNERDLVERRSPEELRYLKDHIAKLRSDPRVVAAAAAHESAPPRFTLEAFRSGVFIDTFPCRMTIGTMALLRGTRSRCMGYGDEKGPLSIQDVAQAVFLLADEARNQAVSVADDADELERAVRAFSRRLDPTAAALDLYEYLRRVDIAVSPDGGGNDSTDESAGESVFHPADDAWADDVDLLAHEYGWTDDHILWEVPIIRVARLKESIAARRSGDPRMSRRDKSGIELLKTIEKTGNEIKANE